MRYQIGLAFTKPIALEALPAETAQAGSVSEPQTPEQAPPPPVRNRW
jgi:hypothetical protein